MRVASVQGLSRENCVVVEAGDAARELLERHQVAKKKIVASFADSG